VAIFFTAVAPLPPAAAAAGAEGAAAARGAAGGLAAAPPALPNWELYSAPPGQKNKIAT
jgi:hypothetical protein